MAETHRWEPGLAERHPEFEQLGEQTFFRQWRHTGHFRDHGAARAVCDLCGNTRLRYHFLVAHVETGEALWVGSECVLNFSGGRSALQARRCEAAEILAEGPSAEQTAAMLDQLHEIYTLGSRSDQRYLRWMVGKFQRRGGFSPADAGWLFQAMLVTGVRLEAGLFPLVLSTKKDRQEIRNLSTGALAWLAPAMTEEQREVCVGLGVRLG
jgi:hypothetical protein